MRMNRRMFSIPTAAAETPTPGEEHRVILFSMTTGENYTSGLWPDAVYGQYSPGTRVTVDLSEDSAVNAINNVEPYYSGVGVTIDDAVIDGFVASFTMPAFDVAIVIETTY